MVMRAVASDTEVQLFNFLPNDFDVVQYQL